MALRAQRRVGGRAQDVWRRYVDVEHWREWSQQGVEWSRVDGPFQAGTTGKMKSPGLRPVTFKLPAAEPHAFFASEVTDGVERLAGVGAART